MDPWLLVLWLYFTGVAMAFIAFDDMAEKKDQLVAASLLWPFIMFLAIAMVIYDQIKTRLQG